MVNEMNTISKKYIVNHLVSNYGEMRHNPDDFVRALRSTGRDLNLDKKDLFHFIIGEGCNIPMATSYGFHTAYGREIVDKFGIYYHIFSKSE